MARLVKPERVGGKRVVPIAGDFDSGAAVFSDMLEISEVFLEQAILLLVLFESDLVIEGRDKNEEWLLMEEVDVDALG